MNPPANPPKYLSSHLLGHFLGSHSVSSLQSMQKLAHKMADSVASSGHLKSPWVLALVGNLGAGKSTFSRYFLQRLGVLGAIPSPSYPIKIEYELSVGTVCHWDWYRLGDVQELDLIGFDEINTLPCLHLIEWADRFLDALPACTLWLHFSEHPRRVRIEAHSAQHRNTKG